MSAKRRKSTIVWILIAVVIVSAFSQIRLFSFVTLPGYGYRAYEWKLVVEFQNMLSNIAGQFPNWKTMLNDATLTEWGKQTDENNDPIIVYSGPTITSYDWQTTQYQDRVRATFKAEVHLWFYGYFPNNIDGAVPLSSIESDFGKLLDRVFPRVFAFWQAIAIIAVAICATILGYGIITAYITHLNMLNERQRWEDIVDDSFWIKIHDSTGWWAYLSTNPDSKSPTFSTEAELDAWIAGNKPPTIHPFLKFLYAVIQSILGWFQTLGPAAILVVCAIAIIAVWGGSGKRNRR